MHESLESKHRLQRSGWLRAAVLGANDGIVSTSALIVGVAASSADANAIAMAGIAGVVAGAMSMAAGEYVSVKSQADSEAADLALERQELSTDPEAELEELAGIYRQRGLDPDLARKVAEQLTAKNALAAHARDELGITPALSAKPLLAAGASAASFTAGAVLPLGAALLSSHERVHDVVMVATTVGLLLSGAVAAYAGGGSMLRGAMRVAFWGLLAMGLSSVVGRLFGATV